MEPTSRRRAVLGPCHRVIRWRCAAVVGILAIDLSDSDTQARTREGLPVYAAWGWPLGTATLGAAQVIASFGRQGGSLGGASWAVATAFAIGAWVGLLHGLLAWGLGPRLRGRIPPRVQALVPGPSTWAAATVGAAVVLLGAWWGIDVVFDLVDAHPLDYDAVGRQIWKGAAGLALTVAAAGLYLGLRGLRLGLQGRPRVAGIVARVAASAIVFAVAVHMARGPFVVYFGPSVAFALWLAAAVVAMTWLPARRPATRDGALRWVVPWLALVLVGGLGLRSPSVRALLLHEGPVFAHVHGFSLAFADGDGDGDLSPTFGGTDCDDDDPAVSGAHKELPANGIDDNCHGGDAPALSATAPIALSAEPKPVVLITIDTVRADHLELYGYARPTMPALAQLGARGRVFERAYAPANHTFFSVTAILAGQSTERMLVPTTAAVPQLSYTQWLPHVLGQQGYHRVAIDPPLLADGKMQPQQLRFDEIDIGPYDFVGDNRGAKSRQVADSAIDWLERWEGQRPVFMWVHFMDPHAVHESPKRFDGTTEADAYDNELSWVDFHLNRLLAAVERTFEGRAVVVVTSDHGEQLGEAGGWGHGFSLRDVELRVPLIVAGPGVTPAREPEPVSLLRVPATIVALLGADPVAWPDAPSLLADVDAGPVIAENPAFLWNERRMEAALVQWPYKLIHARATNTTLLFDLERDPQERHDLGAADPDRRDQMLETLRDALEVGR